MDERISDGSSVDVEVVRPGDPLADGIVRTYLAEVASRWYGRPATAEEVDRALRDEPYDDLHGASGVFLVAVERGRPIACAGARFGVGLGVAELTKVFTLPEARGRGTAARLVRELEAACRRRGIGVLRLDTRAELAEACALYERLGFERVPAFTDDPYSDRWYAKRL
ncbi:GNAT family N-acetyltransferase [Curtobacterium sp. YR515]|uniref:GNAT family N-acetyltransferase n=1 Tax=Curtobacterium sp. YR515 TaxID=1855316 RepID=UPI0008F010BF|nr:GNAT family N-acetyltransferase [Curtobacterium sp. YR515]SFG00667.1 Ribosomal protein S18 acetylase RimI [Curtobacterium sp. YR515]